MNIINDPYNQWGELLGQNINQGISSGLQYLAQERMKQKQLEHQKELQRSRYQEEEQLYKAKSLYNQQLEQQKQQQLIQSLIDQGVNPAQAQIMAISPKYVGLYMNDQFTIKREERKEAKDLQDAKLRDILVNSERNGITPEESAINLGEDQFLSNLKQQNQGNIPSLTNNNANVINKVREANEKKFSSFNTKIDDQSQSAQSILDIGNKVIEYANNPNLSSAPIRSASQNKLLSYFDWALLSAEDKGLRKLINQYLGEDNLASRGNPSAARLRILQGKYPDFAGTPEQIMLTASELNTVAREDLLLKQVKDYISDKYTGRALPDNYERLVMNTYKTVLDQMKKKGKKNA